MKTFISNITVEWAHCDADGIVFYPHFYIWFDQGTERLFKANGLSYQILKQKYNVFGMPLVETGTKYKNASKHGSELELHSWVEEWGTKSLLVKHKVIHADGAEALQGFERRVWAVADPDSDKGMRAEAIPEEVKALFTD